MVLPNLNTEINIDVLKKAFNPAITFGPLYRRMLQAERVSLTQVPVMPLNFDSYQKLIPEDLRDEIHQLAKPLKGTRVAMLNATPYGGGVAEIFKSMIPLMRSLGLEVEWCVMPADDNFFNVTKAFHNALQGAPFELTDQTKDIYLRHNKKTAKLMKNTNADIWEIHDPQPAAVAQFIDLKHSIWRCHIDTSTPNPQLWNFMQPLINAYDELIFTMPQFAHSDLNPDRLHYFTPTIDPLCVKNLPISRDFAGTLLRALGVDTSRPLITQISRFDVWKDPKGVIDVYRQVKRKVPKVQLALVGSMATDDPEGYEIYREVEAYTEGDPDIYLHTNLSGVGEIEVNAFQTYADVVIQKSIREGFGLTVTEAMWKGRPVVASRVGGITLQIRNNTSGYLVNSPEECADRIIELLRHRKQAIAIGEKAHIKAKTNFLHPRLIRDHLKLYHKMLS